LIRKFPYLDEPALATVLAVAVALHGQALLVGVDQLLVIPLPLATLSSGRVARRGVDVLAVGVAGNQATAKKKIRLKSLHHERNNLNSSH
jgi:hypothetical protein